MISSLAYLMSYDLEFIKDQFLVDEDMEIFNDIIQQFGNNSNDIEIDQGAFKC